MIHRRLIQLAGAVAGPLAVLAGLGILITILHVVFAFSTGAAIAYVVTGGPGALAGLAVPAAAALARALLLAVREPLAAAAGGAVRVRLRTRLLARVTAASVEDRRDGATAATLLDGVDGLDGYYTRYLPQLFVAFVAPAGIVLLVAGVSPSAGAVLAVAASLAVLLPRVWDARLLRTGRARWAALTELSADFVETMRSIPLLRAFGATERAGLRLRSQAETLHRSTMGQLRVSLVESAISTLAVQLGTVLAVLAGVGAVASGDAHAASAVVVLLLARECFRPLAELAAAWHAGYAGLLAVDGIERLLTLPPAVADDGPVDEPLTTPAVLELDALGFTYPATGGGVSDVSLRIDPGERLAIVGASGSGKSTLARLLEREIDPDHGIIRLGGLDVRHRTLRALRRSIVVVPQDPVLFAWNVRDNLRLYQPSASEEEVARAILATDLHEVVRRLPHGLDTELGEDGEPLSGGERQRLAIARALLSAAPILVLDEVTSALDVETERRVVDGVVAFDPSRTTIHIAHRASAIAHATRWVTLRHGRIVGEGRGAPSAATLSSGAGR